MGLIEVNCVTVFWRQETWVSTSCNPTSSISSYIGGYNHILSLPLRGFHPISLWATL